MATGLAKSLGKVATLGLVPIVFGPVMNIIGSTLANWWRAHPAELPAGDIARDRQSLSSSLRPAPSVQQDSNTKNTDVDS
jgi:hypothetical protein